MNAQDERREHPTQPEADYIREALAILGEPDMGLLDDPEQVQALDWLETGNFKLEKK